MSKPLMREVRGRRVYSDGERDLPSVTTLLGMISKPQLVPWSARLAVEAAWDMKDELSGKTKDEYLKGLREEATARRNEKRDLGTAVHQAIEGVMREEVDIVDLSADIQKYVLAAQDFLDTQVEKVLAMERTVANFEIGYAGTFDMIALRADGTHGLLDWKTGGIWPSAYYQLLAYAASDHVWYEEDACWKPHKMLPNIGAVGVVQLQGDGSWTLFSWSDEEFDVPIALKYIANLRDVWAADKEMARLEMPITNTGIITLT